MVEMSGARDREGERERITTQAGRQSAAHAAVR